MRWRPDRSGFHRPVPGHSTPCPRSLPSPPDRRPPSPPGRHRDFRPLPRPLLPLQNKDVRLMSPTDRTRPRFPLAVYLFGALAELLFGYDTGVIGVAMLSIKRELGIGPGLQGFIVSSLLLGAAVGVGVAGWLSDRFGRRWIIFATGVVFAAGGLGVGFASDVWALIVIRFVMGLGVGASAAVVSVYLVEVAPTRHRGAIGGLGQLMVVLGILLSYGVGYALQPYDAWRWMLGLSAVPALVLSAGIVFLPETPRWLILHGRTDEARASLIRLGRGAGADTELAELDRALRMADRKPGLGFTLRTMAAPGSRRALFGAVGLALLVQFVGVNSILYFAPTTLVHAGFGDNAAVAANLGIGTANVVFTLVGLSIVDRVGRKALLMTGCAVMATAMAVLGAFTALTSHSAATAWFTLICMIVFLASFAATWGVCVRVVISELFPAEIRGSATGLVLVLNWLANFAVSQSFPTLLESSAALSFFLFAAVCVIAAVFIRNVLPETGRGHVLDASPAVHQDDDPQRSGTSTAKSVRPGVDG
ncbi:sugar porter family MFS transporter [Streptomyces sp. NPDC059850]|uniref:sugar porter family MFS transporter n=1 Tax=Streptomyces sp. NPDC059850 TaxID=3346970 RepID=UPI00365C46CE